MKAASPAMADYFKQLADEFSRAYSVASEARRKGLDPQREVEISPAADVAARVEGLVGPPGIAESIRKACVTMGREEASFRIADEILGDTAGLGPGEKMKRIEQAIRTGLAIVTEGVVSAPIEGISRVELRKNPDGSDYLAIGFAGPIRGAGGTAQAIALMLADYCRRKAGISNYRALGDEVDRYVEELFLYARKTRAGQYVPTEEEIRHIVLNCPVCIDGEPSEDYEVAAKKDLKVTVVKEDGTTSVEPVPNRVRGGVALVISEGICLKAAKVLKISKKRGLDWTWMEKLIKVTKTETKRVEIRPTSKYMDEIVAGRPIFSYPMRPGGFRLRYGRTPFTGIAAKAIHPATMVILDGFPAIGTQLKIERPGKACALTPCAAIEPPTVKLKDGSVERVDSVEKARELLPQVEEILFLGDLLVCFGDFLKANHPLVPSGYVEEWYVAELEEKGVKKSVEEAAAITAKEAIELSRRHGMPLAPRYTLNWQDVDSASVGKLAEWVATGEASRKDCQLEAITIPLATDSDRQAKRILEVIGAPHKVEGGSVVLEGDWALAVATSLGMGEGGKLSADLVSNAASLEKTGLELVNEVAGIRIMPKAGIYVGSSMGRPEKAKPRKMKPPVHSLFPIGLNGGKIRSIVKAARSMNTGQGPTMLEVEINNRACSRCGEQTWKFTCHCGGATILVNKCTKCGKPFVQSEAKCPACGSPGSLAENKAIDLGMEYKNACKKVAAEPDDVKGVMGLISSAKTPEPLEKGILRARHDVSVFRDGTIRFDATELPMTHFTAKEAGIDVPTLRELGYDKDVHGRPIERDDQVVELKCQDIVLNEEAGAYFLRIARFADDLLAYYYGCKPYYNITTPRQLVGQLTVVIAPHTSAGILARIIGFTKARALLAHPYLHCATRRNADGDEDAVILLMDALVNFSRTFLPASRGGQMDAPLVLTVTLDPTEVDDEAHAMDCAWSYPLKFYQATLNSPPPSEMEGTVETIKTRLGSESQYEGIGFTHAATLEGAPAQSEYVRLGNMQEKVKFELELMKRIRAVDVAGAAERILLSHFFPDLYGNLRSFSKQSFRCVECNRKYRRVPLKGKCTKCGGKLLLTINRGGIEKYLELSKQMVADYQLPGYLQQRLTLVEKEIASIFDNQAQKQVSLADYL